MSLLKENNLPKQTIDYYLDEILRKRNLPQEDIKVITDSRKKYQKFVMLEGLIFGLSIRQIYKNTNPKEFFNKLNAQTFRFCLGSIMAMVLIFNYANKEYYIDNKFLLSKYLYVDEKRFYESILNREIIQLYHKKDK